jgi:aldehyde dehydrogenase (NAD+)
LLEEIKQIFLFVRTQKDISRTFLVQYRNEILQETSSGGMCINDSVIHFANEYLTFGGVGSSGMGSYHGNAGFQTFSHQKSVMQTTNLFEIPKRYPPADKSTLKILKILLK